MDTLLKEEQRSNNIPLIPKTSYEDADRLAYFKMVYGGFSRAEQKAGSIKRYYDVAGSTVCLRFSGKAMVPALTPALEHLATEPIAVPDLTICIWDSVSTDTEMPLLISSLIYLLELRWFETLGPRQEIKGFHSNRIRTMFHYGPSILTLMDMKQNLAIYWLRDAAKLPYYEKGYPFTTILNWWMENLDLQCVHAAAIGMTSGGVLLPGKSGSGKSTTALSTLNSELSFLSDDTCIVTCNPRPYAYSLYNTSKLINDEDIQRRLPYLALTVSNPDRVDGEKAMMYVNKHYPQKMLRRFPIKAILVPQITGKQETTVVPTTPGTALKAIAPSSILQLPGAGQRALQLISNLIRELPCYVIELGTDIPAVPAVIANLLKQI